MQQQQSPPIEGFVVEKETAGTNYAAPLPNASVLERRVYDAEN
jgi:hypothetical protein